MIAWIIRYDHDIVQENSITSSKMQAGNCFATINRGNAHAQR
jgi:hypothetical protein